MIKNEGIVNVEKFIQWRKKDERYMNKSFFSFERRRLSNKVDTTVRHLEESRGTNRNTATLRGCIICNYKLYGIICRDGTRLAITGNCSRHIADGQTSPERQFKSASENRTGSQSNGRQDNALLDLCKPGSHS